MNKSKLWILVKNEYQTDIRNKSFWLGTLLMPVIMFVFGGLIGYLAKDSDTLQTTSNPLMPDDLNGWQVAGMMVGIFLTMFIMIYGAQIFNKVKNEKCNRLMEVLATCVTGRTMMLAKILSVGLLGMTQMLIWALLLAASSRREQHSVDGGHERTAERSLRHSATLATHSRGTDGRRNLRVVPGYGQLATRRPDARTRHPIRNCLRTMSARAPCARYVKPVFFKSP